MIRNEFVRQSCETVTETVTPKKLKEVDDMIRGSFNGGTLLNIHENGSKNALINL